MSYSIDNRGFYGPYGGAFIPEILYKNIEELKEQYIGILSSESFRKEFDQLLADYVGRPTPLYFASKLYSPSLVIISIAGKISPCKNGTVNSLPRIYSSINNFL